MPTRPFQLGAGTLDSYILHGLQIAYYTYVYLGHLLQELRGPFSFAFQSGRFRPVWFCRIVIPHIIERVNLVISFCRERVL